MHSPSALLLPHRDLTFRLGGGSPFTYVLQTVQVVRMAPDGVSTLDSHLTEEVIVKASTPEAQATIDRFALNGAFFDRTTSVSRIPFPTGAQIDDSRVELRTRAWHTAAKLAGGLRHQSPTVRHAVQMQFYSLIAAYGFWSVWATVLWDQFRDRRLLSAMLLPPASKTAPAGAAAAPRSSLSGNAGSFPGTRADALFHESESGR